MANEKKAPVKKSVAKKDVEITISDPVTEFPSNTVTVDEAAVKESKQAKEEKMVRVATTKDHRCRVGGETYYFTKGKQVTVPQDVKFILKNAGILAPL